VLITSRDIAKTCKLLLLRLIVLFQSRPQCAPLGMKGDSLLPALVHLPPHSWWSSCLILCQQSEVEFLDALSSIRQTELTDGSHDGEHHYW